VVTRRAEAPSAGRQTIRIPVSGMTCAACQSRVQHTLQRQPGVADASVNFLMQNATVTFDPAVVRPVQLVDAIREGMVDAVINVPEGLVIETLRDGFHIRRAAAEKRIPCLTSLDTAMAAVSARMSAEDGFTIQPIREYLAK